MDSRLAIGGSLAAVLVAAGAWYYLRAPVAAPAARAVVPASEPAQSRPAIEHALEGVEASAPLPELDASDDAVRAAIAGIASNDALQRFLVPDRLLRRLVATIDNLPRAKVDVDVRPVVRTPGEFRVAGDEGRWRIDDANFSRYEPFVAWVRDVDVGSAAAIYRRFYPLLQRAYEDLGYPDAYFNDRVVAAIDDLLASPEIAGPIALVRPSVAYEFADAELERKSAGQKLMLRMGTQNAAVLKRQLRDFRAQIVSQS